MTIMLVIFSLMASLFPKAFWKRFERISKKDAKMIFQDPQASLNGRMKIRILLQKVLDIHVLTPSKKNGMSVFNIYWI